MIGAGSAWGLVGCQSEGLGFRNGPSGSSSLQGPFAELAAWLLRSAPLLQLPLPLLPP